MLRRLFPHLSVMFFMEAQQKSGKGHKTNRESAQRAKKWELEVLFQKQAGNDRSNDISQSAERFENTPSVGMVWCAGVRMDETEVRESEQLKVDSPRGHGKQKGGDMWRQENEAQREQTRDHNKERYKKDKTFAFKEMREQHVAGDADHRAGAQDQAHEEAAADQVFDKDWRAKTHDGVGGVEKKHHHGIGNERNKTTLNKEKNFADV